MHAHLQGSPLREAVSSGALAPGFDPRTWRGGLWEKEARVSGTHGTEMGSEAGECGLDWPPLLPEPPPIVHFVCVSKPEHPQLRAWEAVSPNARTCAHSRGGTSSSVSPGPAGWPGSCPLPSSVRAVIGQFNPFTLRLGLFLLLLFSYCSSH